MLISNNPFIVFWLLSYKLFSHFRVIHHWVPPLWGLSRGKRSLKTQFSFGLQKNWGRLLHKWLFVGGFKWVTVLCLRAQMIKGSRKILTFLAGLYLMICLQSSLTLSRQLAYPYSFTCALIAPLIHDHCIELPLKISL